MTAIVYLNEAAMIYSHRSLPSPSLSSNEISYRRKCCTLEYSAFIACYLVGHGLLEPISWPAKISSRRHSWRGEFTKGISVRGAGERSSRKRGEGGEVIGAAKAPGHCDSMDVIKSTPCHVKARSMKPSRSDRKASSVLLVTFSLRKIW